MPSTVTSSADGRSRTVLSDTDGDGTNDYTETSQIYVDGSQVTTGYHYDRSGHTDKIVTTVSADGLTRTVQEDRDLNGKYDALETRVTHIDGSSTTTHADYDSSNKIVDSVVIEVSANGESRKTTVDIKNAERTFVSGDDNAVALNDGETNAYVSGETNRVWLEGGSLTVASGASVTVYGANDTIIAATDASVTTVGSNDQIIRTQANVSYTRGLLAQNADSVKISEPDPYGFSYITAAGDQKVYYEADNIPARAQTVMVYNGSTRVATLETTHIFLNGSQAQYTMTPGGNRNHVAVNSLATTQMPWMPSLTLTGGTGYTVAGYIGTDNGLGNWVTAIGSTPVYISGSQSGNGRDYLQGGDGDDTIDGGRGTTDVLLGGAGNDTIFFDQASYGKSGGVTTGDYLGVGLAGKVTQAVDGSAGYDTGILTNTTNATIDLATGNLEALIANAGNDTITGNSAVNGYIDGGAGNDTIIGGAGADIMDGGAGIDTLSYDGSTTPIRVALGEAGVQATSSSILVTTDDYGDKFVNFENVIGGTKADTITGNSLNNVLSGGAGADTISGGAGDDLIIGGADADIMDGGAGTDTLSYAASTLSVSVTLGAEGAQTTASGATGSDAVGDKVKNFENIIGGQADDTLTGNASNNVLTGGGGGGTDTYVFAAAQQSEIIVNGLSSNTGPSGELDVAVDHDDLWFVQSGNDLVIDVLGTCEQITIKDWYKDTSTTSWEQLSKIAAQDGLQLTSAQQVNSLVQAMATFSANYQAAYDSAFDPTAPESATITDAAVLAAQGNAWHA